MGTVKAAAYHRNGVGGIGFYVGLVEDDGRELLVITFEGVSDAFTAVIDPGEAAAGNIYMHPQVELDGTTIVPGTGGNAWRGDVFAEQYRDKIIAKAKEAGDAQLASLIAAAHTAAAQAGAK